MTFLTKNASETVVPALTTCGGIVGPLFPTAKAINKHGEGELEEILPSQLHPMAERSLEALKKEAIEGKIMPESVLRRYGLPAHFQEMKREAEANLNSVAGEIPAEIRAVAHTLLPLKNGIYANEGRIISFRGLVPLGPQEGNLVVHLAGVFASHCPDHVIRQLLREQAKDKEFLKMADKVGVLNYEGTNLQRLTMEAKRELGL